MLKGRLIWGEATDKNDNNTANTMNDKAFPLTVQISLGGNLRNVATAFEALECLLGSWPITRCREYRSAVRACRDCLDGLKAPSAAFRAFRAACRVAGVLPTAHGRMEGEGIHASFSAPTKDLRWQSHGSAIEPDDAATPAAGGSGIALQKSLKTEIVVQR